ncbi:MAG: hypothetical protein EAZ77_09370 [Nostocales cyanobacterium]|nr:MAG: hypothetical protein EAZ77_09370 [Nostocales cyanobacterium]
MCREIFDLAGVSRGLSRSQSLTGNAITETLTLLSIKADPLQFIPIQSMGTRNEKNINYQVSWVFMA